MGTRTQVVFDAANPHRLAGFWAAALHYEQEDHSGIVASLLAGGQLRDSDVVEIDGHRAFRDVGCLRRPRGHRLPPVLPASA